MERVTYRLPKEQIEAAEVLVEAGEFPNVSECLRSMVRRGLNDYYQESGRGERGVESWRQHLRSR